MKTWKCDMINCHRFTLLSNAISLAAPSAPNADWIKCPAAKHPAHLVSMSIEMSFNCRWCCECCSRAIAIESIEWRRIYIWNIKLHISYRLFEWKISYSHHDSVEWCMTDWRYAGHYLHEHCSVHACRRHLPCPSLAGECSLDFQQTSCVLFEHSMSARVNKI